MFVISSMEGDGGARGPLCMVRPELWMHVSFTEGVFSSPGRYFSAWSILLAMSATPNVRKLPSAPRGSPPFHGFRMMVEPAHTDYIRRLRLLNDPAE